MSDGSLNVLDMLSVRMSYDAQRQKELAQNLSNIDTPGYKAKDLVPLSFKNVLAAQVSQISPAMTSPLHMTGGRIFTDRFRSEAEKDAFELTPTGGTVVLEEQMMKVAQNATDYQMSTNLYKKIGTLFKEALGNTNAG